MCKTLACDQCHNPDVVAYDDGDYRVFCGACLDGGVFALGQIVSFAQSTDCEPSASRTAGARQEFNFQESTLVDRVLAWTDQWEIRHLERLYAKTVLAWIEGLREGRTSAEWIRNP